jgi:acyl dehydratase
VQVTIRDAALQLKYGEVKMKATKEVSNPATLYLEDLYIGRRFVSGTHILDEDQIKAFARQFDPQPFHLDDEAARSSLFSGLAASGWHTAAITMNLLVTGEFRPAGGIIGAGAEVTWPAPTRPGDVLRVESEVTKVATSHSRTDRGMVTISSNTLNQRGDILQKMIAKLVVQRRTAQELETENL